MNLANRVLKELTKTEAEADDFGRTVRFFKRIFTSSQDGKREDKT